MSTPLLDRARDARAPCRRRAFLAAALLACTPACAPAADDGAARRTAGPEEAPADANASDAGRAPGPRLVVLYAACTVDRGHLAPYADPRAQVGGGAPAADPAALTPRLAEFARDAVVFRRHVTEAGSSGVAFASLVTGAQADVHGVYRHPARLDEELVTLAEAFRAAGYDTHLWSGHRMADPDLGYAQGFRVAYVRDGEDLDALAATGPDFAAVLERLRAEPDYRAFVQVNLTLTHSPYDAPLEELERHPPETLGTSFDDLGRYVGLYRANRLELQWDHAAAVARLGLDADERERLARAVAAMYAACVAHLDRRFGTFVRRIDEAGLRDDALVAFTADHGETLDRPGVPYKWCHTLQVTPEVWTVPLLIRAPGLAPGAFEPVSRSIDVFPTLAGLCGVAIPAGARVQGVDLGPALRGEGPPPELPGLSHTALLGRARRERFARFPAVAAAHGTGAPETMHVGARRGDLLARLVSDDGETFRATLHDLAADPGADVDVLDETRPAHRELLAEARTYKARLVATHPDRAGVAPADGVDATDSLDRLRALGYVDDE